MRAAHLRSGFTLIEVLAVIVLLALVAGALTVRLGAVSEASAFRATRASLRDLDARARLFARSTGAVVMRVEDEGRRVVLRRGSGAELAAVECPQGVTVAFVTQPPAAPATAVTFDRLDRAPDYGLELARAGRSDRWWVCGETGWTDAESVHDEAQGRRP